jgi:glc operon protein GlcG
MLATGVMTMAIAVGTAHAQLVEKTALTLDGAKRIAAAAEAKAHAEGARVVIAVVDAGGTLLLLERLDDTQVASVNVGIDKARTAAIYRRPSKVFEEQVKNGRVSALALHGAVALQGGVPITVNGNVIGAIGVSGETPQQDEDIAIAGAAVAASFRDPNDLKRPNADSSAPTAHLRRGTPSSISEVDAALEEREDSCWRRHVGSSSRQADLSGNEGPRDAVSMRLG